MAISRRRACAPPYSDPNPWRRRWARAAAPAMRTWPCWRGSSRGWCTSSARSCAAGSPPPPPTARRARPRDARPARPAAAPARLRRCARPICAAAAWQTPGGAFRACPAPWTARMRTPCAGLHVLLRKLVSLAKRERARPSPASCGGGCAGGARGAAEAVRQPLMRRAGAPPRRRWTATWPRACSGCCSPWTRACMRSATASGRGSAWTPPCWPSSRASGRCTSASRPCTPPRRVAPNPTTTPSQPNTIPLLPEDVCRQTDRALLQGAPPPRRPPTPRAAGATP